MKEWKKNYKKPEVEVIKLDKELSFMTASTNTNTINEALIGSDEPIGGDNPFDGE